ncbi:restriction endonuclease subunit S [Acinetobacter baumannii]|nr:restriction endonuclease subunit S [Acinetobacter baumannii]
MAAPKLRFKEFDGDWSAQKYKDALTIKYGKDHKLLEDGEIPVYGTGGVMRYVNQYLYDGESILIGRKGTIDQPKYVNEKFWTVDTLFYSEIKQNIYPLFIYQHALQVNWLGLNEATGVPSLNTTSINNVDIYLPSKEEQTKIASFLSAVDEKISQLTQKHELLSQYKQGMMQKLFSQQIRFKADDGSEFGEWENSYIGNECKITTGNKDTQNKVDDGLYPFFVRSQTVEKINSYSMDCEAILTSGDGVGVGKNYHYINGKFDFHQRVYCLYEFSERLIGKYLYIYFSNYFYDRVKRLSAKNSVDSVRMDMISKMEIKLPCLEEQTKIANLLSAIDQKVEVVAQQIEQAKQWKKGLLQQMFI